MGGAPSASLNGLRQCSTAAIGLDWRTGPTEKNGPTLAAPWGIVQTTDGFCTSLHNRPPETRNRIEPDRDAKYTACGPCGRRGARKPPCPDLFSQCATRAAPTTTPIPTPGAWHAPCPVHVRFMPGPCPVHLACHARPCPLPCPALARESARHASGPAAPRTTTPRTKPRAARRACRFVAAPRPDQRPVLFRFDQYDNDAHLGHGYPPSSSIPVRATSTASFVSPRSGAGKRLRGDGTRRAGSLGPRSSYPQCPASRVHTGPIHRPC